MPPLLLMVDDAPETALVAQLLSRRSGHDLICKTDAATVLAWLEGPDARRPDLLLLDLRLPSLGGIELYKYLKRNAKLLDGVPAALFTQGPSPVELGNALKAGIDYLVSKECLLSPDGWKTRIDEVLSLAAHPPVFADTSPIAPLDGDRLRTGLARVMTHPALASLEGEGIRGLWARVWIRARQELTLSQEMFDATQSSVTLGQIITRLASSQADVVVYLVQRVGYQIECLIGRSAAVPVQAALAAVLIEARAS